MIQRLLHIVAFFLSTTFTTYLSAQAPNLRYNFKHLNVQNGLAQNVVYHFLQDSHGYMWLGTRNGLTLYDGTRTINFLHDKQNPASIGSNFITRLLEDSLGQIWIGTDVGLSRFNRKDNNFSNFHVITISDRKENAYCVPLGFANAHELWLIETETKSVRSFDTRTLNSHFLTSTSAVDGVMLYDSVSRNRHIWTYLSTGTIHLIFKNHELLKEEFFFTGNGKDSREPILQVVHVLPQNDSATWLSTTLGLIELNPHTRKYILHKNWEQQTVNELRYTAISPTGSLLWVATGNNGVYTFDLKTRRFIDNFRSYRLDPFSICSNNIVSLYFDHSGNIWCGSYGNGSSYTDVERNYFQKNLSRIELEKWEGNNNVHWIGHDYNNSLWCTMNDAGGLWKLNKEKRIVEHRLPILKNGEQFTSTFHKMLFYSTRYAWCVSDVGLFQYDVITNRLRKMDYPVLSSDLFGSYWINDILRLEDGSFLFSTYRGLYRIVSKEGSHAIEPISVLNKKTNTSFTTLYQDETGNIYVKDLGDSMHILNKSKESTGYSIIQSIHFLAELNQFYPDVGNKHLLLATNYGLFQLNRSDFSLKKVSTTMPVPFLSISGVIKTDGKLWLFGEKGLFCWDEKNQTARTFTVEDGLPANEFNVSALSFSPTGECIAATTNGLVSFFPDHVHDTIYPPMAQLTNIYINDAPTGFVPNSQETDKINLSHDQNTFSFDFSPIAFQNASECTFEYKLESFDEDWIKGGTTRYTRYSKIPPGKYLFHLRVIDANGRISPNQKTLEIEIAKAFWQTNLFKAGLLAIILLGSWFVLKWYLNTKIRKQKRDFEKQAAIEKERTRIATDMHDDLGAGLSRIKFLSESIQFKKGNDESIKNEVEKIASYSDEMVEKMGEIVWALNEKNDTVADLIGFTRSYAGEYLSNHNIQCIFYAPEVLPISFVTGEMRRNIFLSVKECLHNVVKHAKASVVTIYITIERDFQVIIYDNGVGINLTNIRPFSNGLTNIQKRMKEVGGKSEFKNSNGTSVILNVPFHE